MSNETPWYPHVKAKDGTYGVQFGWGGRIFVLALCGVLGSAAITAYRLEADDEDDAIVERNIKTLDQNIRVLDEQGRLNAQAAGLANKQLRRLLEIEGVTERIEPPPVPPSKIEALE